jgi:23S rRNA (uracil1939-C5)-methyltransferase
VPQIEVAVADNCVALVLRILAPLSAADQQKLQEFESQRDVRFYLQPGGIHSVHTLSATAPALHYRLPEAQLELEFLPTDFIQVNGAVNRTLVDRAAQLLQLDGQSRVLDLYCGLGNFSLALARRAQQVVGVEGDTGLVERARSNARRNSIDNAEFFACDLNTDISAAAWYRQRHTHVLIDPPRVGARELLPHVARLSPQRLLYVSCHPATLARDVGILVHDHGYGLEAAGVVDMFAHTTHVESVAVLGRNGSRHGH